MDNAQQIEQLDRTLIRHVGQTNVHLWM